MEVAINKDYLVSTLHLREDVAGKISSLKEGDKRGYYSCLAELQDHSLADKNATVAMLCLEAKLKGKNKIEI